MIWFTSDCHFLHQNVINLNKRPFSNLDNMHEQLTFRWNLCVNPHDTIFVLGDLSLGPFTQFRPIAERLNGTKFLIKGNHDGYSDGQYKKLGFTVFHELKMKLCGKTVRMSHYPYALPWYRLPFAYPSVKRFLDRRPPKIKGEYLMHGHTHTKYKKRGYTIHVGVDAWNYTPVSLAEIESLIDKNVDA